MYCHRKFLPVKHHKTKGTCVYAPETEEHHYLKRAVMIAARKNGWKAQTEVKGVTPSGEEWIADVLAQKGKYKIAIEIQWSGQTNEETLRRQQRYKESGIRGLWMLRQPGFPVTRDLPAICIGGDLKEGFGNLVVLEEKEGQYEGGCTGFPQFKVGVDCRHGDFLAMDVHEWHGNLPIQLKTPDAIRLSVVCYLRTNIFKQEIHKLDNNSKLYSICTN